jgi:glutathione peroxidase
MNRNLSSAPLLAALFAWTAVQAGAPAAPPAAVKEPNVLAHKVQSLDGQEVDLGAYRGKALLIVNTASKCGYTPQYASLQKLYDTYKARGLVVLGFPSNDFGGQEPGSATEIAQFCQKNYGVTFPMMAKVHAKGPEIAPVYRTLTQETGEGIRGDVKWNFTKFLVDPQGRIVRRFEPDAEPTSPELKAAVEAVLPGR